MNSRWIVPAALALALPSTGAAQTELPPIVESGFELLVSSGPSEAIDHWTTAWTSESDVLKRAQLKGLFVSVWEQLGPAEGYEILAAVPVGSRVIEVYALTVHRMQPLFFYLRAYDAPGGWMVNHINTNTVITEVIPDWLLRGRGEK